MTAASGVDNRSRKGPQAPPLGLCRPGPRTFQCRVQPGGTGAVGQGGQGSGLSFPAWKPAGCGGPLGCPGPGLPAQGPTPARVLWSHGKTWRPGDLQPEPLVCRPELWRPSQPLGPDASGGRTDPDSLLVGGGCGERGHSPPGTSQCHSPGPVPGASQLGSSGQTPAH